MYDLDEITRKAKEECQYFKNKNNRNHTLKSILCFIYLYETEITLNDALTITTELYYDYNLIDE